MPETPETAASPEDITADLPVEPPAAELEGVDVELGDAATPALVGDVAGIAGPVALSDCVHPPPAAASLASDPDDDQLEPTDAQGLPTY